MTSGIEMRRIAEAFLFILTMTLPTASSLADEPPAPASPDWGLVPLMADLHQIQSVTARFVEDKYLAALTRPLETAGALRYVAPSRIERIATEPPGESVIVEGDSLTTSTSNGQSVTIALEEHPEIAALVEGFRSTLAGDLPTLRRYYTIEFSGARADWHLSLTPKNPTVRQRVDLIRISGTDATLKMVEVQEHDGDHSVMIVTPDAR